MSSSLKRSFDQISRCETKASSVRVYRIQQNWRIENFGLIRERYQVGQELCSDVFGDKAGDGYSWKIIAYPYGEVEKSKDFVTVALQNVTAPSGIDEIRDVNLKFTILDSTGRTLIEKSIRNAAIDVEGDFGWRKFWKYSRNEETITIICEAEFIKEKFNVSTKTTATSVNFDERATTAELLGAIKRLRETEQLSDFSIVVLNGEKEQIRKFAVHRNIIAAQSPVFAVMFDGVWSEVSDGSIELESSMSVEAVDALLDFLYSGTCAAIDEYCIDLLNLAEKYQVKALKALCEARLCANVGVLDVGELYSVAKLFRLELLEVACRQLFVENEKEILQTVEWAAFKQEKAGLALQLVEYAALER